MDSSLLFGDEKPSVPDSVLQNLLIKPPDEEIKDSEPVSRIVLPEAGFCLKTKSEKGDKVFINVCLSDQVPSPKDITDDQLDALLESGDPSQYRVPISLGDPHDEVDNSGKTCKAYDVIIGTKFYKTTQERQRMKEFLLTIVLEGLEEKHNMLLSRDCRVLKNRKFIGPLPEQNVRQKPKPFIIEMNSEATESGTKKTRGSAKPSETAEEASPALSRPAYSIIREPLEGEVPEFLVMEVRLPGISSSRQVVLEVGEDRVELRTRPSSAVAAALEVDLPYLVDSDETGAQFNTLSHTLTITLPVTGIALL